MQEYRPLISVIIPNYNHATYLNQRISSILSQTYTNLEVIILDDCSTDNSIEIIDQYHNDKRIAVVVKNESNSGSPFAQWKKGVSMVKGDVVWIAESDDACDNSFLEKLLTFYIKNGLVMAFTISRKMDTNGSLGEIVQKGISHDIVMNGRDYITDHISLITNASSAIFSRDCAMKIDNNYYEYKGTGDWLFWTGIASQGKVGIMAEPLNFYRVHDCNTTSKMFSNGQDFFELKKVYSYLLDKGYWSKWIHLKNNARMVYAIKNLYKFDNDAIKEKLLNEWNSSSLFNLVFCFLVRCNNILKACLH